MFLRGFSGGRTGWSSGHFQIGGHECQDSLEGGFFLQLPGVQSAFCHVEGFHEDVQTDFMAVFEAIDKGTLQRCDFE